MEPSLGDAYDANFYSKWINGMTSSAREVLGLIYKLYRPESVVDIGCGRGAWLTVAESFGSTKLKGFDGSWVKKGELLSKNIDFTPVDFVQALPEIAGQYDLCISLEVAEHVSEADAKKFVDTLCKASKTVLFGAAIRHQGGVNHINEQWQSYWIELFRSNGYECFDIIRANLWNMDSVEWWYRQNTFLFCHSSNESIDMEQLRLLERPVVDIVHPLNYEYQIYLKRNQIENPTLEICLKCVRHYLVNNVRRLKQKVFNKG